MQNTSTLITLASKTLILFAIAFTISVLAISSCGLTEKNGSIHPVNLRCENLKNPIAIDVEAPLLSWILESELRGQAQSAYRIIVSGSKINMDQDIGDYWDTGKLESDISVNINYEGKPLKSRDLLFWKVKVWDAEDNESAWSEVSTWEMSFLATVECGCWRR